jgi:hypothetical protein
MSNIPLPVRRMAAIIGILMLVFIMLEFNRRVEQLKTLDGQYALMLSQATQAVQTQGALNTQVAYAGSNSAVEEWARIDGHYVQDGDLPVVPIEQPGAPPIEASTPAPTPTPMQNWEVWWGLFFGK